MPADNVVSTPSGHGHMRWGRFAVVAVPALAVAGILVGFTAEGAIASSISVSGQEFLVTATQFRATGFEQFGGSVANAQGSQPVIITAMHNATIDNLCQSVSVGPVTLRLTAGSGSTPVSASNLIVDASSQTGSVATFHNITIGQDAGTLSEDPGTTGTSGGFGQQADTFVLNNLVQHTWLTTAGTFSLPGLSIGFGGSC
jgi:Family of unknown function (DUF6230)